MASTGTSNIRHHVFPRNILLIENDAFNNKWDEKLQEIQHAYEQDNLGRHFSRHRLCGKCRCPGHVRTSCPVVKIPRQGTDQEKADEIIKQMMSTDIKTLYTRQAYLVDFMRKDPLYNIGACPKTHRGYEGMSREFIEMARERFTARRARAEAIRQRSQRVTEEARRANDEADSVLAQASQAAVRSNQTNILDQPQENGRTLRELIQAAREAVPGHTIHLARHRGQLGLMVDNEFWEPIPTSGQREPRVAPPAPPALPTLPTPPAPPAEPKPEVTVKDKAIDDKTCPICMDDLTECNRMVGACGHQFHASCMMTWASQPRSASKECPCCRSRLFE